MKTLSKEIHYYPTEALLLQRATGLSTSRHLDKGAVHMESSGSTVNIQNKRKSEKFWQVLASFGLAGAETTYIACHQNRKIPYILYSEVP